MDSFIDIFQGLPVVLLISLVFGLTALIRIYFLVNPGLRRLSTRDRRLSKSTISFPFHDAKNNIVTEERRKLVNRRLASHVIVNYGVIH